MEATDIHKYLKERWRYRLGVTQLQTKKLWIIKFTEK